ncbi:hypothetical protein BD770DRAFT_378106 [Pilaira anomala]|nr:hypothetical protein BD770DRAFT_378106 [Pilaira anomala]
MVYLNSHNAHINTHYSPFDSNISRNPSHQLYSQPNNALPDNSQALMTSAPNKYHHQQNIWNSDNHQFNANTENGNDMIPYNGREIIVPSQLNEDNADNGNPPPPPLFQPPMNTNARFVGSDDSSVWHRQQQQQQQQQQHNSTSSSTNLKDSDIDGDTSTRRGLGIYMSSRQHYEDMIKRPPP